MSEAKCNHRLNRKYYICHNRTISKPTYSFANTFPGKSVTYMQTLEAISEGESFQ